MEDRAIQRTRKRGVRHCLCQDRTECSRQRGGCFTEQSRRQQNSINTRADMLEHESQVGTEQAQGNRVEGKGEKGTVNQNRARKSGLSKAKV